MSGLEKVPKEFLKWTDYIEGAGKLIGPAGALFKFHECKKTGACFKFVSSLCKDGTSLTKKLYCRFAKSDLMSNDPLGFYLAISKNVHSILDKMVDMLKTMYGSNQPLSQVLDVMKKILICAEACLSVAFFVTILSDVKKAFIVDFYKSCAMLLLAAMRPFWEMFTARHTRNHDDTSNWSIAIMAWGLDNLIRTNNFDKLTDVVRSMENLDNLFSNDTPQKGCDAMEFAKRCNRIKAMESVFDVIRSSCDFISKIADPFIPPSIPRIVP